MRRLSGGTLASPARTLVSNSFYSLCDRQQEELTKSEGSAIQYTVRGSGWHDPTYQCFVSWVLAIRYRGRY